MGDALSDANRFGAGSPDSTSAVSEAFVWLALVDVSGEVCSAFFSLNLASNPSTRFRRASKTSVLGPRFFGTASIESGAVSNCSKGCQELL